MNNLTRATILSISFIISVVVLEDKKEVFEHAEILSMKVLSLKLNDRHLPSKEKSMLRLAPGLKTAESINTRSKQVKYKTSFTDILSYNTTQLRQLVHIHKELEKHCDFQLYE